MSAEEKAMLQRIAEGMDALPEPEQDSVLIGGIVMRIVFVALGSLFYIVGYFRQLKSRGKDIFEYIDGMEMCLVGILWVLSA